MKTTLSWLTCLVGLSTAAPEWDYGNGPLGPANWARLFPEECAGNAQSPVALSKYRAVNDSRLTPFRFQGHSTPKSDRELLNKDGHTVEVELEGGDATLSGGGLKGEYKAAQFHFHWGSVGTQGSEHTLDGRSFPLEMHIVHYSTKFRTIQEAVGSRNGLAVLAFFFEWSPTDNPDLNPIVSQLANIREADTSVHLPYVIIPADFSPWNVRDYYRYTGGLTTPTCNEVVVWTVFKKPQKISPFQMDAFRTLKTKSGDKLVDNFRPIQPINRRKVTFSAASTAPFRQAQVLLVVLLSAAEVFMAVH